LNKLKDIVPTGKGMKNVQLLVGHPEDRNKLCKVGEVGEIYVRVAGLVERYRGDQALNGQKFLMDWFAGNKTWVEADKNNSKGERWRKCCKEPRNMLCWTGDLSRYLESSDVECIGCVDDQVKIRGFRIELNDIDSDLR
jgi:L-2-aminoadipate reductase